MSFNKRYLYNFDDVTVIPSSVTSVNSRSDVDDINQHLWVAPMDTVINNHNLAYFLDANLNVPLVRGMWLSFNIRDFHVKRLEGDNLVKHEWGNNNAEDLSLRSNYNFPILTFTLDEAKSILLNTHATRFLDDYISFIDELNETDNVNVKTRILIDIANGHMKTLHNTCELLANKYQDKIEIYIGNIANPSMFLDYNDTFYYIAGIRVGIGGGSRCYTSSKTAIHYPMASLIDDIAEVRESRNLNFKIIADGGIRDSSDVIKAFALGADGVMLGKLFNQVIESAGKKYLVYLDGNDEHITLNDLESKYGHFANLGETEKVSLINMLPNHRIEVDYRGMSTIDVQLKEKNQTSQYEEGFSQRNVVKHTLDSFLYEMNKSVKSAFSYCDATNLTDFQSNAVVFLVSSIQHNKLK